MVHPRLTRYELEIMDVIWRREQGTVQQVCDSLSRPLAYTTVMTTLNLLTNKKKVLARKKQGRAYVYRALLTREEVSRNMLDDLQDVLFSGSLPSLVLNLVSDKSMSKSDVQALKAALDKVEKEK